jgi:hypothetical protein
MNMKPTLTLLTALLLAPLATLHAAAPRPNIIISRITVIARCADKNTELGLNWIEFQP